MVLKVVLPLEVLLEQQDVASIVVETTGGMMGFRPLRQDCVAFVVPGVLSYETRDGKKAFLAIDEGVLVKAGPAVTLSIHGGVAGADSRVLEAKVEEEFARERERERQMRAALKRLETTFLQQCKESRRHG